MRSRRSTALPLALFAVLFPCAHSAGAAGLALAAEDYMVDSGDPGIRLFIRNKHPAGMTQFRSQRTVLYVHGATQAASSTFDLSIDGESWMDHIARQGYDVYLVDLRGYGRSTRPPEFNQPATDNPPVVRTDVAVRDVEAAVDFVLAHRKVLGYGPHGPIREPTQGQGPSARPLCAGMVARSANPRFTSAAWRISNVDDGRCAKNSPGRGA